ncbi:hypothetical protein E0E52_12805 [Azotobacter chroococcum]|nr:hypothetical protein E0E52_12805 [Azotobacter chroococcum]
MARGFSVSAYLEQSSWAIRQMLIRVTAMHLYGCTLKPRTRSHCEQHANCYSCVALVRSYFA